MINTLETIERSIYSTLLRTAIALGFSVDPLEYYPLTSEKLEQFKTDVAALTLYVPIFGAGNAQSKGSKIAPRIVVDSHGYFPGSIGMPRQDWVRQADIFEVIEYPYETLDHFADIRLISGEQKDIRILHEILFHSIPRKGYIPAWPNTVYEKTGNIFIEMVNFFDQPNLNYGLIEKVYQFSVLDSLVTQNTIGEEIPINEINLLLESLNLTLIVN